MRNNFWYKKNINNRYRRFVGSNLAKKLVKLEAKVFGIIQKKIKNHFCITKK